jgi:hypothetical protein
MGMFFLGALAAIVGVPILLFLLFVFMAIDGRIGPWR